MSKVIATPSRTKEILEKYDLYAKKNYGQNFLIEPGIVDKIASHAIKSDKTLAIEIGPGIGALTQSLCEYASKVVSFEIDDRLIDVLADTLSDYDNVTIIHKDFLEVNLKEFVQPYIDENYEVVIAANLPYYITTPLLFHILESKADIKYITVMMQKEVADRFSAEVNSKDYNALTVITQYRCNVKQVMKIPRNVFNPKPNVDSAVIQFEIKKDTPLKDETAFFEMVKACFKQRRKTMLNNLGEYLNDKEKAKVILNKAEIKESERAQALSLTDFMRLYEVFENENRG